MKRTVLIHGTVLVLDHVRGFRLDTMLGRPETIVWLDDVPHAVTLPGDHLDTLRVAIDEHGSKLVLIESPYKGDVERNERYACAAMRDAFMRGEYPFASHLLYTRRGILRDDDPEERALGIAAGLAWGAFAARTVLYTDHGVSDGMRIGIDYARITGRPISERSIGVAAGEP